MKRVKSTKGLLMATSMLAVGGMLLPSVAAAQDGDTFTVIGSRSTKARSATDSPVPIDTISGDDFDQLGNGVDITDNLKALVPSYTATPATGDGSAFVRPTSLRGLKSDQTLVLVDGKRRHKSALIQFFAPAAGNGAHAADVAMIPSIALKRIEVLRDGAAAQYGSDAIAGVMNFVTKDDSEGGSVVAQIGQFYEGENSYKFAGNMGMPLGDTGFLNVSAEYVDNDALSRGIQRPDAQALIDGGAQGVGGDSPFGDAPLVQTWGRPETSGLRLFANAGMEAGENADLYFRASYGDTDGRYRFFYRNPSHSSLATLVNDFGYSGSLLETGYTPYLDGAQTDYSIIGGLKGETDGGWNYDFSIAKGSNELDYFLNNTTNPSLGLGSDGEPIKRDFDVGALQQEEVNINADFSKLIRENVNLALGAEWREDTYTITAGEMDSYTGAGSNGFGGFKPQDSGEFSRDNYALYGDIEHDISDNFLLQYALRYEDFSDVGDTLNGKVAARYNASDNLTFRGAISTGFHAPTPGQANVRTTITTFDGVLGVQVEEGLVPPTSPLALQVGGAPLTEEKSVNYSLGMSTDLGTNSTLTVDVYKIDVSDHIYRTGDIAVPGSSTGATISFYTNALDVTSSGVDVVLTSNLEWSPEVDTDVTLALNYNTVDVTGQSLVNGIQPVSDGLVEDIENNYPDLRFVLTGNTQIGERWNLMTRANYYGSHYDERGRINDTTNPSAEIDPTIYFDAELDYEVNENMSIALGAVNIFDTYVDEIGPPNANRLSVGLPYPRRSAANYEGGSFYLKGKYNF
ncbi:MAG: TonB-dependent receptor plug domain-containing protein [bacterium]